MASNSDTIYHVLSYIKSHPDKVFTKPDAYDNVVEMYLDDTVKLGNPEIYFPKQKLEVNRMSSDFLSMYSDLLVRVVIQGTDAHQLFTVSADIVVTEQLIATTDGNN